MSIVVITLKSVSGSCSRFIDGIQWEAVGSCVLPCVQKKGGHRPGCQADFVSGFSDMVTQRVLVWGRSSPGVIISGGVNAVENNVSN